MEHSVSIQKQTVPRSELDGTALIAAAQTADEAKVQALLEAKASIEAADKYGSTALSWAAGGGREEVVRALLLSGAHARPRSTIQYLVDADLVALGRLAARRFRPGGIASLHVLITNVGQLLVS